MLFSFSKAFYSCLLCTVHHSHRPWLCGTLSEQAFCRKSESLAQKTRVKGDVCRVSSSQGGSLGLVLRTGRQDTQQTISDSCCVILSTQLEWTHLRLNFFFLPLWAQKLTHEPDCPICSHTPFSNDTCLIIFITWKVKLKSWEPGLCAWRVCPIIWAKIRNQSSNTRSSSTYCVLRNETIIWTLPVWLQKVLLGKGFNVAVIEKPSVCCFSTMKPQNSYIYGSVGKRQKRNATSPTNIHLERGERRQNQSCCLRLWGQGFPLARRVVGPGIPYC